MSLEEHRELTGSEVAAGLVLVDPLLFRLFFFKSDLEIAPSNEQKLMFCDESERVLLCTGRKIAKTVHLEAFLLQHGLNWEGEGITEALMFTPSDVHLVPFLDRVIGRINNTPVIKGMVRTMRRGDSPLIEFSTGLRWYLRIEGLSGKDTNMVGIRAALVVGDEMAFGNWICHNSRLQTALPNCLWLYAGVPNGIRNSPFYAIDQQLEGRGWSKHKYPTFINPLYGTEKSRAQLADDYGGVESQGYRTQVLGEWGEEVISSFPPGSFVLHQQPYYHKSLYASRANSDLENIALMVGFPSLRCYQFAVGWDYGYSPDPSEIFGFYRASEVDNWKVYCRLTLRRIALQHQVEFALHIIRHVFSGEFIGLSTDKADAIQILQGQAREMADKFLWANPAGATAVAVRPDDPNQAEVYRHLSEVDKKNDYANIPNKEFYVNLLKGWLVNAAIGLEGRKLELGNDAQVANELITTTERKTAHGRTQYYGPPDPDRRSVALDHNFDALSYGVHAIWAGVQSQATVFSEAALLAVMGWVGNTDREWKAPYGNN